VKSGRLRSSHQFITNVRKSGRLRFSHQFITNVQKSGRLRSSHQLITNVQKSGRLRASHQFITNVQMLGRLRSSHQFVTNMHKSGRLKSLPGPQTLPPSYNHGFNAPSLCFSVQEQGLVSSSLMHLDKNSCYSALHHWVQSYSNESKIMSDPNEYHK
jgi:hypothetical protein